MNIHQIQPNQTALAIGKNEFAEPVYYVPRPHQMALHAMRGRAFMRALIMGYGGGKTLFGCAELVQIASMYPGARLLDVSPSYKQARRTTIETYSTMLDATGIAVRYNKSEHEYRFPNGSVIWIASGDNPDTLKGPNISHARIDEPFIQDRAVYDQVIARLRLQCGPLGLVLTGTPEQVGNWGYDLLYGDDLNGRTMTKAIIQASTLENTHLPASYIENLYASYDERMIAAYLEGQFVSLDTKQAYYQFDSTVHCGPLAYDPDRPLYLVFDFNVEPFCANVVQQHGEEDRVIAEIHILRNGTTERACDEFLRMFGGHKAGVVVTGDPAGTARNVQAQYGGYNNFSIVKDKLGHMPGYALKMPGQVPMLNSINLTNSRLRDARGAVRLKVDSKCKYTIQDFERVMRDNDNKIDKSDDGITHHSDGLRYYLWTFRKGSGYGGAA